MSRRKAPFSILYRSDCVIFFFGPTRYKKDSWQKCVICLLRFPAFLELEEKNKALVGAERLKMSLDDLLAVGPTDVVLTNKCFDLIELHSLLLLKKKCKLNVMLFSNFHLNSNKCFGLIELNPLFLL